MNIRLRTKKLIWAGVIGASVMLILSCVAGYFFYTKSQAREIELRDKYKAELSVLNDTVKQNEEGWALTTDVKRGEIITQTMIEKVTLPKAAKSIDTIEAVSLNSTDRFARADMKAHTVLVETMLYENDPISDDVREGEYAFIELPTKLKNEDFVDIRIQFPNGDDFIFLSKKQVKEVNGLTMWVNMNEGEQLTMSSAIVDAFVEEAKIYAMPYVDGPMQNASSVTYPVKTNVMELIKSSPNIVNIAELNLEKQNRQRLDAGLKAVDEQAKQKLRQGQSQSDSKRAEDDAERELNTTNQFDEPNQEDLISTTNEGADEE